MPPACNLFFEGIFFSAGSKMFVDTVNVREDVAVLSFVMLPRKSAVALFEYQPCAGPRPREGLTLTHAVKMICS